MMMLMTNYSIDPIHGQFLDNPRKNVGIPDLGGPFTTPGLGKCQVSIVAGLGEQGPQGDDGKIGWVLIEHPASEQLNWNMYLPSSTRSRGRCANMLKYNFSQWQCHIHYFKEQCWKWRKGCFNKNKGLGDHGEFSFGGKAFSDLVQESKGNFTHSSIFDW